MKAHLSAALAGLLFGAGLVVSGMTRPEKVIGFLDVLGRWDASLVFVMASAVVVHFAAFRWMRQRQAPLFDTTFHLPTRTRIDARLVAGAAVFGVGWGLAGLCPGPGLLSAAGGTFVAIAFVVGMTAGVFLERTAARRLLGVEERR